jgi:hypothetical protein
MTVLIPSDKGFECKDCDFKTEDIFLFLEHCDVSFTWGLRLSNRYSLNLFTILEEINSCLQNDHAECALDLVQSISLALVNASEGEQSFHKFVNEAMTKELATDMVESIEEMLKKNEKPKKTDD